MTDRMVTIELTEDDARWWARRDWTSDRYLTLAAACRAALDAPAEPRVPAKPYSGMSTMPSTMTDDEVPIDREGHKRDGRPGGWGRCLVGCPHPDHAPAPPADAPEPGTRWQDAQGEKVTATEPWLEDGRWYTGPKTDGNGIWLDPTWRERWEPVPEPAVPEPPPRTEWALYQHPDMDTAVRVYGMDPDWVMVRPCDLRSGDRIAWGDAVAEVLDVDTADGRLFHVTLRDEADIHLRPWSPVLVRRSSDD